MVEELLGRGGSGQVWRARPRSGGEPVALKVLVHGDPGRQAREATMLGELDHPHLVHLHDVVRHRTRRGEEQVALVLDLLAGGSLAALLARRGRLRPGEVVTAIAPVAAALAHAHERGVVHGDLSPANIVFTAEGRPVLTDLGVARVLGDAARAEVTPAYVDPTVARGGAPGPASDVFGVAAAAFHALTGVAPWNAAGPWETLHVAASGELPDLDVLAPEAPAELRRVIRRGLSAEPHARGSAAAFALDLRHSCRPEPVRLPEAGVPDAALGETGRGPRTELTHQVPGRRPRAVHAAPVPPSRWARLRGDGDRGERLAQLLRSGSRRVGALVLVGAALLGAGWLGTRWGGTGEEPAVAVAGAQQSATAAAQGPAAPGSDPGPAGAPPVPESPGPESPGPQSPVPSTPEPSAALPPAPSTAPTPDPVAVPAPGPAQDPDAPATGDLAGWRDLVNGLYEQRARAFVEGRPDLLDGVYPPTSGLAGTDRARIEQLAAAGERLDGFAPTVTEVVRADVTGDRAELDLVDSFPDYRVVRAGSGPGVETTRPGRAGQQVRMVLVHTASGWLLESAVRSGQPES
ncbi:protein kinase [Modestobacter sp. I12A-02628]|uniref:non-specific serine/threonine protein kinase n=1 Tax=Goekera deserti TaxID=2497753 RepID=A0A7K3WAN4_9ACTN|nr:protein kinase [Goekera deserti]NDI47764.1 protein kinase [Goekera deserti]NEL53512.1 protein kinase [Goekera deserti]